MSGHSRPTATRGRPTPRTLTNGARPPASGRRRSEDGAAPRRRENPDQERNSGENSSRRLFGQGRGADGNPLRFGQQSAGDETLVRDRQIGSDSSPPQIGQRCGIDVHPARDQFREVGNLAVVGELRAGDIFPFGQRRNDCSPPRIGQRRENGKNPVYDRLRGDENPVYGRLRGDENPVYDQLRGDENPVYDRLRGDENPVCDRLRGDENPVYDRLRDEEIENLDYEIENPVNGRLRDYGNLACRRLRDVENPVWNRLRDDENPAYDQLGEEENPAYDQLSDDEKPVWDHFGDDENLPEVVPQRSDYELAQRDRQAQGQRELVVNRLQPLVAQANPWAEVTSPGPSKEPLLQDQTMEGGDRSQPQAALSQESRTLKDENNFIQNVSQFFNQEDISDVVLKVGEKKFFGHKFVLAKSSEVFRTMLYDKRWQQAGLPEIDLEETEECQRHFEPFLRFLYTAEVQICTESAVGILCLADKYSVMSLKNLCTRYMVENTQSPKVRNALNWYSWAKALHMDELIDSCTKTISWNMEQLFALPEWLQMEIDFVADILSNPQLVVSNEHLLYNAVERWLLHENHLAELAENSKKLLPLVRFPQMMVQQLYKVETGDLASKEGSKDLIEKLLNQAYRFRSLCPFQAELSITFNEEFYRPRNYKDLMVDTVRMQNTLRFGIQVDVRTYVGPVPSTVREGEWKITYRKSNDSWTLQVYCHDSAMVNGEARIQAVLVISDDEDRVLQVEASEETICSRGNHLTMVITLPGNNEAKLMTVLIKPLPN